MTDVLVERCVLKLVTDRPWGFERDEVVRRALEALPGLIGEALSFEVEARGDSVEDRVITEPVRVTVAVRDDELRFVELGLPPQVRSPGSLAARVAQAVSDALEHALGPVPLESQSPAGAELQARDRPPPGLTETSVEERRSALLRLLGVWRSEGRLARVVAAMSEPAILRFLRLVVAPERERASVEHGEERDHLAMAVVMLDEARTRLPRSRGRGRGPALLAALDLSEALQVAPYDPRIAGALEVAGVSLAPLAADDAPAVARPSESAPGAAASRDARQHERTSPEASAGSAVPTSELETQPVERRAPLESSDAPITGDAVEDEPIIATVVESGAVRGPIGAAPAREEGLVEIDSALPFLVVAQLVQLGWFEAVTVAAEAQGAASLLPALVAGLARKSVPEPARGWNWSAGAARSVAACAGRTEVPSGAEIARAEEVLGPALELATGGLLSNLREGHRSGAPLLRVRLPDEVGGDVAFFDTDGLFPLSLSDDDVPRELILAPDEQTEPGALGRLAGMRTLTDARPRGEGWRRLRRGRRELWTTDPMLSVGEALSVFREHAERARVAVDLFESLAARPALPPGRTGVLDRAVSLATAVAWGSMAWRLWKDREATDPLLALERFANLDARVVFEPARVLVKLPMGPRYRDLFEQRLLPELPSLPWLDGRTVAFSGG